MSDTLFPLSLAAFLVRRAGILFLCVGALVAAPENLIFNGSFELGLDGFDISRALYRPKNPKLTGHPARLETGAAAHGKQSMRIPNPFGESVDTWGREFRLKGRTTYHMSLSAKSGGPAVPIEVNLISVDAAAWLNHGKSFTVENAWKRYEYTFTTGGDARWWNLLIRQASAKDASAGDLWLDEIKLVEGAAEATWSPSGGVEAGVALEKPLYILKRGPVDTSVRLAAANYRETPWKGSVGLELSEEFTGGKRTPFTNLVFSLAPGEVRILQIPLRIERFGTFAVEPTLDGKKTPSAQPGHFAVVGEYVARPIDIGAQFCVGVNGGMEDAASEPNSWRLKPGATSFGGDATEYLDALAAMGCRLLRDWDPGGAFGLASVAHAPGAYDFSMADDVVKMAGERGIALLPILGGSGFTCSDAKGKGWPAWIKERSARLKAPEWMKGTEYIGVPPDEIWRPYVRALASRYKGRITHWEVGNEPNLYLPPATYVPLLKGAFEEIRAADPRAKVVGFCATGDLGGEMGKFFKACYELGALAYADVVSIHPYDAPELSSLNPADRQIESMRSLMKPHGAVKPLWNTELYYFHNMPTKHWWEQQRAPGEYAARRFLTDLGEGMGQSISQHRDSLFQTPLSRHLLHKVGMTRWLPSDTFVVLSAMARLFEGSKPVKKIRWPSESICYVYERSGAFSAAFWRFGATEGMTVRLALDEGNAELCDFLGNALKPGPEPLALRSAPFYVKWKGKDLEGFLAVLTAAKVEVPVTLSVGSARFAPRADKGWNLLAALSNPSDKPLLAHCGVQGAAAMAEEPVTITLAPASMGTFAIPVRPLKDAAESAVLKAWVNQKIIDVALHLDAPGKVYAVRKGAGEPAAVARNAKSTLPSHSASFQATRSGKNLVVEVGVKDGTPSGDPGSRNPWDQDCVEFFIDADPLSCPMKGGGTYHDRVARVFVNPHAPKEKQVTLMPRGLTEFTPKRVAASIEIRADGYRVTLTVPFAALGLSDAAQGALLGFDLAVDDAPGPDKSTGQLLWNSGGDAYKNRFSFGFLRFE
jgi:hypothetical protein